MKRIAVTAQADLLERARELMGLATDEAVIDGALEESVGRESAKRLADLLGSESDGEPITMVPRRRSPTIVHAEARASHRLQLWQSDGHSALIDVSDLLTGPVFTRLLDPRAFAQVVVDDLGAPIWSSGADLAPESAYERFDSALDGGIPETNAAIGELLEAIHSRLPQLECLLNEVSGPWVYDEHLRHFYGRDDRVFAIRDWTLRIVASIESLAPDRPMHPAFRQIMAQPRELQGNNDDWFATVWPMLEAFTHARGVLDVICRFGSRFNVAPGAAPSGWAAVLRLFGLNGETRR